MNPQVREHKVKNKVGGCWGLSVRGGGGSPGCVSGSQGDLGQETTAANELTVGGAQEESKARTTVRLWL